MSRFHPVIAPKIELPTFGHPLPHSGTGRRRRGISGDRYNQAWDPSPSAEGSEWHEPPIFVGCGAGANQYEGFRGTGRRGIWGGVAPPIFRFLPTVGM